MLGTRRRTLAARNQRYLGWRRHPVATLLWGVIHSVVARLWEVVSRLAERRPEAKTPMGTSVAGILANHIVTFDGKVNDQISQKLEEARWKV